jgi:exonuclease VII large subunit
LVADARVSTPTHAGKFVSEGWLSASRTLSELFLQISQKTENIFNTISSHISRFTDGLSYYLKSIFTRLEILQVHFYQNRSVIQNMLFNDSRELFNRKKGLESGIMQKRETVLLHLKSLADTIKAHDPELKLKQGYSIAFSKKGSIIKSVKQLKKGDILRTQFTDGVVESEVKKNNGKFF